MAVRKLFPQSFWELYTLTRTWYTQKSEPPAVVDDSLTVGGEGGGGGCLGNMVRGNWLGKVVQEGGGGG